MIIWDAPAVYLTQIFIHFGKEKKKVEYTMSFRPFF